MQEFTIYNYLLPYNWNLHQMPQKLPCDLIEKNGQVHITKLVFYNFFSLLSQLQVGETVPDYKSM